MRQRIKIAFSDFKKDFDPRDNYFTRLLSEKYEIEIADRPDFLLYSCFGSRDVFRRHDCIRIFYTGENIRPNFQNCDYAFTFDYDPHPNHYRLPLYALYVEAEKLVKREWDPKKLLDKKTGFCNFLYSNRYCRFRNDFFHKLSKYKRVDAGGKVFNNIGGRVADKLDFIRRYKFTIAFENCSHPGYTTEKIAQPMLAGSLPIYWGDPLVHQDFNPASFLNYFDFGSQEALIERIIEVDQNDDLYCHYLGQPWYHDNRVNAFADGQKVLTQFDRIFSSEKTPIARQSPLTRTFIIDHAHRAKQRISKNWRRAKRWAGYQMEQIGLRD